MNILIAGIHGFVVSNLVIALKEFQVLYGLAIVALLFIVELFYFRLADRFNIIDKPNLRSSHTQITLRGGGIIFLLGAWIYTAFYGFQYPWFLAGLTAIAGISFMDDIRPVPNKYRLLVHFASMLLMFQDFGILNSVSSTSARRRSVLREM